MKIVEIKIIYPGEYPDYECEICRKKTVCGICFEVQLEHIICKDCLARKLSEQPNVNFVDKGLTCRECGKELEITNPFIQASIKQRWDGKLVLDAWCHNANHKAIEYKVVLDLTEIQEAKLHDEEQSRLLYPDGWRCEDG